MANIYITEFSENGRNARGGIDQVCQMPPVTEQVVAIGGASAQSVAFANATTKVRVQAGGVCHVAVGSNPTATTSNMRMAIDQTEYFGVNPGDKIAVIAGI